MYEYAPEFPKKKEKLLATLFALFGFAFFLTGSLIPSIPFPGLFQVLGILLLSGMILLFSLCIAKHYVYRVEQREDGSIDFIITERTGHRIITVCRVSVASILQVIPVSGDTKEELSRIKKGRTAYFYTGVMFGEARYELEIEESGVQFWVQICANEDLIRALTSLS